MTLREPAGWERDGGNSAEPSFQAWAGGGSAGNTCGTVRGSPRGRYPLTEFPYQQVWLSAEACLYRLFLLPRGGPPHQTKMYGGHERHEI